jgi:glycosyltransferase involved in cell wall biosynthesis
MYTIGFVMEQALGHVTHAKNLQRNLPADPSVQAHWAFVPFESTGLAAHLPIYNSNWTVRSGLRARRMVAGMARKERPDALFFHTQVPATLALDWIKRIPSVVSLDATPLQYDAMGNAYGHAHGPLWTEMLKWQLQRRCFAAAHRIVTWSAWAKQSVVNDYDVPAAKVEVIPPAVNLEEWVLSVPRTSQQGPVKILFVGGDFERKGGPLLLEAWRSLRPWGAELHVVTRTPVPMENGLHVYSDLQPNSSALKHLYHTCDIFCLPTKADTLGYVFIEAGAAGLPVVATRMAGIPEVVREGETGFLVPPDNGEALAAALTRLVESPELRLKQGRRAIEVISRDFDAKQNARRLLNLLKETVDEARGVVRAGR